MRRVHQACHGRTRTTGDAYELLLEAHALVAPEHRVRIAPVATGDLPIALAQMGRNVGDLVAALLART
jgi:hypothetical protein